MDTDSSIKPKSRKRKAALNASFCVKKERNKIYQKVSAVLQKPAAERTKDEAEFLNNSKDIVEQITLRKAQRQKVKDRTQEYEDPVEILAEKCKTLAEVVTNSNHLIVYTGAGISTAACIPDYRGSNGIWTLLQQGKDIGLHDLSQAEPTLTHMALYCLYRSGIVKHIVSQNCDGLHLRSGIPRTILSEVHGNMYLEVCSKCKPSNHYLRLFDVTEYTARYSHETLRLCYKCGNPLKDTIVHFGERGKLQWPLNWDTACKQADKADVILCLGSSLKVLKKYPWLWCMDKPAKKRPKLYIVNLQWTPKDDHSTLKINGKCDAVIELMMSHLGLAIPQYVRSLDPIFYHATVLHDSEIHTTSRVPIEKNNMSKQKVSTANSSRSPSKQENGQSDDSYNELKNHDSSNDLSTSCDLNVIQPKLEPIDEDTMSTIEDPLDVQSLPNIVQAKLEPMDDDTMSTIEDPSDMKSLTKEELESSDCTSGLSANIKIEPILGEYKQKDETSTYTKVDNSEKTNACGESDDLLSMNSNDSILGCEELKEDTSVDTSSDKENHEVTNVNEESIISPKKSATECVVEETAKQTVIQEKSIILNQSVEETSETTTSVIQNAVEIQNRFLENDGSNLVNALTMQTFASKLSQLCGSGLWSDLSVFDVLTNQPILFGRSLLEWSDMNSHSLNLTSFTHDAKNGNALTANEARASSSVDQARDEPCLFCYKYYCSHSCLFYATSSSNAPLVANSVCLCCGGEDDDEEQPDEPEDDDEKTPVRVPNINPGWFGKGYRKKMKYKKR